MPKLLSIHKKRIKQWMMDQKVLDIIFFGSTMRGKFDSNDIDLCIIINDTDEKKSLDLIHSLGSLTDLFDIEFHINILTTGSFFSGDTLAKTLLNEGYSLKNEKNLSFVFGYENKSMFLYSLKDFSNSKRVKFHYLLKGRNGSKGILKEIGGKFIGTGTLLVSSQKEDVLKEIFDQWSVEYEIERILLS